MENIQVYRGQYPGLFGGVGFHNNDAMLYPLIDREFFWQKICKSYREINPGFMRTFAGYANWTKPAMDLFAEYYNYMQRWTDTPMYLTVSSFPLHFSEEESIEYCEKVADNLAYLYFEKDVKHIRYYCLSNELTRIVSCNMRDDLETIKKYHMYLYHAFQKRNLPIGLLATDAPQYENWPTVNWALDNMLEITDDCCVHIYERTHDTHDLSFYDFFYHKCLDLVQTCISRRKRLILGECGIQQLPQQIQNPDGTHSGSQMSYHFGVISDTCRYYHIPEEAAYCALMMTELSFAAINAGVYALAYWTFIDCPDPYTCRYSTKNEFEKRWAEFEPFITPSMRVKYNKWGAFKWENDGNHDVRPHYWALAPLMKFFGKNVHVLETHSDDPLLRTCAVIHRFGGAVTMGVVNRHKEPVEIRLDSTLFQKTIRVYEYDPQNVPYNRFADMQAYSATVDPANPVYTLKPESVAYFTTDYIEKAQSVYAENLRVSENTLSWDAVSDPNHCYYRVFAGDTEDFIPDAAHQIGSTAAEYLPLENSMPYYKVLSVDCSGNI